MFTKDVRDKILYWARWGAQHEPDIHYTESAARDDWLSHAKPRKAPVLPLSTDCSGFVTLCFYLAGAPDPNGLSYKYLGYTGTLLAHGQHIPLSEVQPGDVIVYGPGTGWHTALVVKAGKDPLTVSHGQESGPEYVYVSQDGRQPQTYLRFPTSRAQAKAHKPAGYSQPAAPVPVKRSKPRKHAHVSDPVCTKKGAKVRYVVPPGTNEAA